MLGHGGMATATGPLSDPFEGQETAAWRGEQRKLLLSERVLHLLATPSKARRSSRRGSCARVWHSFAMRFSRILCGLAPPWEPTPQKRAVAPRGWQVRLKRPPEPPVPGPHFGRT
jgi:hypothetical protein